MENQFETETIEITQPKRTRTRQRWFLILIFVSIAATTIFLCKLYCDWCGSVDSETPTPTNVEVDPAATSSKLRFEIESAPIVGDADEPFFTGSSRWSKQKQIRQQTINTNTLTQSPYRLRRAA